VTAQSIGAFATPTVVQLTLTLLVAALMTIPWPSLGPASLALAACGGGGLLYGAVVIHRARHQDHYRPDWSDWLWYAVLPCGAHALLLMAAVLLPVATRPAAWALGLSALGLLMIGIHNAWDTVTHIVTVRIPTEDEA
jgi:hypothetical protein